MNVKFFVGLLPLLTMAATVAPTPPPKQLTLAVERELRRFDQPVDRAAIRSAIQPVNIDGDNRRDWQVDYERLGSIWCGTGGCRYQLWRAAAGGTVVRIFDRQVRDRSIVIRGGRPVFVFDFHGSECGGFGAEACPGEFAWDKRRGRMALLNTPRKHTSMGQPIVKIW